VAAAEEDGIFGFETGKRCIEHFPARHDDDIEAADLPASSKQFPRPPFGPVALDGGPEFPGCRDSQSRLVSAIGHDENRHEAAVNLCAGVVDPLEFRASADPTRRGHYGSSATVKRLRPLARRRLSTMRPFFVDIRTLKPCVFFRRLVLGW
jgi:hypothetical protein